MNGIPIWVYCVLALIAGNLLLLSYLESRELRNRFKFRKSIPIEAQLAQIGIAKSEINIAMKLICKITTPLRLDPSRLRLTDRFDRELAATKGNEFDGNLSSVYISLERYVKEEFDVNVQISEIETIQDLITTCLNSIREH
jgi:hypothetical protein